MRASRFFIPQSSALLPLILLGALALGYIEIVVFAVLHVIKIRHCSTPSLNPLKMRAIEVAPASG